MCACIIYMCVWVCMYVCIYARSIISVCWLIFLIMMISSFSQVPLVARSKWLWNATVRAMTLSLPVARLSEYPYTHTYICTHKHIYVTIYTPRPRIKNTRVCPLTYTHTRSMCLACTHCFACTHIQNMHVHHTHAQPTHIHGYDWFERVYFVHQFHTCTAFVNKEIHLYTYRYRTIPRQLSFAEWCVYVCMQCYVYTCLYL